MRGFRLFHQSLKSGSVVHRNIRQDFAIKIDARSLQTANKLTIRNFRRAACSINSDNPKRSKIPLLSPPSDVSVTERFLHRLLGGSIQLRFGKKKAFGKAKCFPAVVTPACSTFNSRHVFSFRFTNDPDLPV
jgi:hypothetical protein